MSKPYPRGTRRFSKKCGHMETPLTLMAKVQNMSADYRVFTEFNAEGNTMYVVLLPKSDEEQQALQDDNMADNPEDFYRGDLHQKKSDFHTPEEFMQLLTGHDSFIQALKKEGFENAGPPQAYLDRLRAGTDPNNRYRERQFVKNFSTVDEAEEEAMNLTERLKGQDVKFSRNHTKLYIGMPDEVASARTGDESIEEFLFSYPNDYDTTMISNIEYVPQEKDQKIQR